MIFTVPQGLQSYIEYERKNTRHSKKRIIAFSTRPASVPSKVVAKDGCVYMGASREWSGIARTEICDINTEKL